MKRRRNWDCLTVVAAILVAVCLYQLFIVNSIKIEAPDISIEVGDVYRENVKASFLGFDFTRFVRYDGVINPDKAGEYTISYDCLGAKAKRTVTVGDLVPPEIELIGEETVLLENIDDYKELGVKAKDNVDGDLSKKVSKERVLLEDNHYVIKYTVQDSSQNTSEVDRHIFVSSGIVYLTFDDGPSELTSDVLDILKKYNVRATFFVSNVLSSDEGKIEILKKALENDNAIGLHGLSHEYSKIYKSVGNAVNNFYEEADELRNALDIDPKIIRFPGGSSNTISKKYCKGVMTDASEILVEDGYSYFDWNVDSNDAGADVNKPKKICKNVIDGVVSGRNNVVLLHDGQNHSATVKALPEIIETLQEEGYEFGVLSLDVMPVRHDLNN